jgi:predicted amidohydrolase
VVEKTVKVALAQFSYADGHKEDNLRKGLQHIQRAADLGAEIVLLPEMFSTGYVRNMEELAESMQAGKTISALQETARQKGIAVVGSMAEWDKGEGRCFNSAFFIGSSGEVLGTYRKIHLFDQERKYVRGGHQLVTVNYQGITYGLLICFDLEFPEPSRQLARQGVEVLLVVSANMHPYGFHHRIFAQARAIENHMFVAYCNRSGRNKKFRYMGQSCLVNPCGQILCQYGEEDEGVLTGVASLKDIATAREVFNYLTEAKISFS